MWVAIWAVDKSTLSAEIKVAEGKRRVGVSCKFNLIRNWGRRLLLLNSFLLRFEIGCNGVDSVGVEGQETSGYLNLWEVKVVW